jgi:hypothetical protein
LRLRFTLLLFLILNCLFQEKVYSQISAGAYTGYAKPKLVGDSAPWGFYDLKGGGIFGLRADIPLSSSIKLSVLPAFIQYRGKLMIYDWHDEPLDSLKIRFNTLFIPLGLTVTAAKDRFYVFGGIEFRIPLSLKAFGEGYSNDISKALRKYNLAIQFSAGYKVPIGRSFLYFELGYSQSILKLGEGTDYFESEVLRVRQRDIRFLIGIQVPLGKKANTKS